MKKMNIIVPFYINPHNMKQILNGKIIENFEEMHNGIIENIKHSSKGIHPIYKAREKEDIHKSEYPDIGDEIIALVLRYVKNDNNHNALELEVINSLAFCKLDNPVIKIHGYFYDTEDGNIDITKVTRLTIGNAD